MSQTIDIVIPDLGDFENIEVIEVLVSAGDTVEREEGLITVEMIRRRWIFRQLRMVWSNRSQSVSVIPFLLAMSSVL